MEGSQVKSIELTQKFIKNYPIQVRFIDPQKGKGLFVTRKIQVCSFVTTIMFFSEASLVLFKEKRIDI